jgi:AcrR family transcriptional regulator
MDTRRALLSRARQAFAEQGYGATSLEQLAGSLGLTKAAVYYHFPSKRALLEALLEEALSQTDRILEQPLPLEERLYRFALAYRDQIEPLSALMTAQSNRRGRDQEAIEIAKRAMAHSMERLAIVLERAFPGQGKALAAIFASIVHGAYMLDRYSEEYEAEPLLRLGVSLLVRGAEALRAPHQ